MRGQRKEYRSGYAQAVGRATDWGRECAVCPRVLELGRVNVSIEAH
jgi:hypothetical protein